MIGAIYPQLVCLDVYKTALVPISQWLSINVLASIQIQSFLTKRLPSILQNTYYQHKTKVFTTNLTGRKALNATLTHNLLEDSPLQL